MVLNICPYKDKTKNCFDNNIILSIVSYWNREYMPYHLCDFDFQLVYDEKKALKKIRTSFSNSEKVFSLCSSICLDYHEVNDPLRVNCLIIEELQKNRPVGVKVDSFYLPWSDRRGIIHETHYILIIGLDERSDNYIITDGYLSDKLEYLPRTSFFEIEMGLITFSDMYHVRNEETEIVREFFSCFREEDIKLREDAFHQLIGLFSTDFFEQQMHEIKSQRSSSIVSIINDVANSRRNFRNALGTNTIVEVPSVIIEKIDVLCEQWEKAKNLILKGLITNRVTVLQKGLEIIAEIEKTESSIISELVENSYSRFDSTLTFSE